MCGIVGFWSKAADEEGDALRSVLHSMTRRLTHRGPDGEGIWMDPAIGLGLGHRRLAVIDKSVHGQQPMISGDARFVLIFNGEIYNFRELRSKLERRGHRFRGHSDTEVMLAAIVEWGLAGALPQFTGMFAFALWDTRDRVLHLCRDRMGEKPLYYGWLDQTFVFASELNAVAMHPRFAQEIDRDALMLLLRFGYIPAPHSIYQSIYKLEPGVCVSVRADNVSRPDISTLERGAYWSVHDAAEAGCRTRFEGNEREAATHLEHLLMESVRQQMIADVPVGAFLSGGVDSSVIVALMQSQSARPVKTYTIGFQEDLYDEAAYARAISTHLGTDHTELCVTPEKAAAVLPTLCASYDEPIADPAQLPTFLVADLARRDVTVALTGDGADELFGGYRQYVWGRRLAAWVERMPSAIARLLAGGITAWRVGTLNRLLSWLPTRRGYTYPPGDSLHRLAAILAAGSRGAIYRHLMCQWQHPAAAVIHGNEPPTVFDKPESWAQLPDFVSEMMYVDQLTRLPDAYLMRVDRATMAVSLESRAPFLDHRLVEFSWQLPADLKLNGREGKVVLKDVLGRYLPKALTERPKQGFVVPVGDWLRDGRFRDWAESLLDVSRLSREGLFRPQVIRNLWDQHLAGSQDWHIHLWSVLAFQAWLSGRYP